MSADPFCPALAPTNCSSSRRAGLGQLVDLRLGAFLGLGGWDRPGG
jgi:hypothetical protein